jgi:hypothetical protein
MRDITAEIAKTAESLMGDITAETAKTAESLMRDITAETAESLIVKAFSLRSPCPLRCNIQRKPLRSPRALCGAISKKLSALSAPSAVQYPKKTTAVSARPLRCDIKETLCALRALCGEIT